DPKGGDVRMQCAGTGGTVAIDQELDASSGDAAWFAIRPENVAIALDPPADRAVNALDGEVWDIGYLGDVSIYHVRLKTGATVKATGTQRTRLVGGPIHCGGEVSLNS